MKTLTAIALFAAALTANAGEMQHPRGATVDFEIVSELVSEAGESKDAFLTRAAADLHKFTEKTGFEACARLGVNYEEKKFSVVVTTNNSHIGCLVTMNVVDGFYTTPDHIHSHPQRRTARANRNDLAFLNRAELKINDRINVYGHHFSPTDFAAGEGYLVTHKELLHQAGVDNVRVVAPL
jgi:hypothetical protein